MMPLQNRERIEACLAKLRAASAGGDTLVLLMTTSGAIAAWHGAGSEDTVADLGVTVTRVVKRAEKSMGSRSTPADQPGPPMILCWWTIHQRWILAVLGRQSAQTQATTQWMIEQLTRGSVAELCNLLPNPQHGWENPKRWSMS
jgi:hypothetical protein